MITDAVRRLDMENSLIMADTRALMLSGSESASVLQEVLYREKKSMKKIVDLEKQTNNLHAQFEDVELRALEMERELIRVEREAKEVEAEWKQKSKEKEEMLALLSQETKNVETRKARSRAQLKQLHEQVKTDSGLANDKCQRPENELAHIREFHSHLIEVMDSEKRLSEHFSELQKLRMERKNWEKMKTGKNCSEMSVKLLETERTLGQANTEASLVNDALKRLEIENDRIRAEVAAFNLNASESERELKQVLKREKRYTKKLADVEKQSSVLRSLCDEENQRAVELEQGLFLAETEAKETEAKWKQKSKELKGRNACPSVSRN
ncbi:hypothetical protein CASFOL_033733 [Castilleja foliolosa]|uniref:Uncharacterized protein n=1 Tax=Castilleja foliolosa TaxID=1961234 RepID=A0ABD3C0D4_9LAMI